MKRRSGFGPSTAAGFLPLMLAGGGFWPPLAVVIVGGVAGATLLALYFVPAAHLMLAKRARRKMPLIAGAAQGLRSVPGESPLASVLPKVAG